MYAEIPVVVGYYGAMESPFAGHGVPGGIFEHINLMVVGVSVVSLEIDVPPVVDAVNFRGIEVVHVAVAARENYFSGRRGNVVDLGGGVENYGVAALILHGVVVFTVVFDGKRVSADAEDNVRFGNGALFGATEKGEACRQEKIRYEFHIRYIGYEAMAQNYEIIA